MFNKITNMYAFSITFEDDDNDERDVTRVYYFPDNFEDEIKELEYYLVTHSKHLTTDIYQNGNIVDDNVPEELHSMLYGNDDGESLLSMQHKIVKNTNDACILLHINYY